MDMMICNHCGEAHYKSGKICPHCNSGATQDVRQHPQLPFYLDWDLLAVTI